MGKMEKEPYLKLTGSLSRKDCDLIHMLEEQCVKNDQITLKLELDYKRSDADNKTVKTTLSNINEFLYFHGEELIGYMGICSFGGSSQPLEITGMVHPQYRRRGIFSKLSELVITECRRRNAGGILALCDRNSITGQKFLEQTEAVYNYSEFEMYLHDESYKAMEKQPPGGITFRKAVNAIEKLKELKASEIMLQVAAENAAALSLYKSCGFRETSVMDYFEAE